MKAFRLVSTFFIGVLAFMIPTVIAFSNPEMTQTQLFVTFWPFYIAVLVLMWIAYAICPDNYELNKREKADEAKDR